MPLNLKAGHKSIKAYYEEIGALFRLGTAHEGAVSPAFASLLRSCASQLGLTLVEQYSLKRGSRSIVVDGAVVDAFNLPRGYWEAKDTGDDLDKEIKKKFEAGYPRDNILFQAPNRIVIWQDPKRVFDADTSNPELLVEGLKAFFDYQAPHYEQWKQAVDEFKLKVRELATVLLGLIEKERTGNAAFVQAFADFVELCQETINPNISIQAVEEMLIQHLLTERIFRNVFRNSDFVNRNVIAREIEKVISALTSQYFSRNDFLKPLDRFYVAIESTADTIDDFSQKQSFLNSVYEKFFQGFSVKVADTHGIVYTPQPIVSFMVKSVEHILQKEFGRSLSDKGVHIIDPFVGTGNFILSVMREVQRSKLLYKYANELHCNEVMLLPYYIASMNIEHEYYEATGSYLPFEGICLVDTFDLAKVKQLSFFTRENTVRVKRQQSTPIFVVIGNPPYNAGQVNENDNNKNRKYEEIDKRVSETYGKGSKATLRRKLNDPYVKAIRWASDRIRADGIVALVTNNSFVAEITFDGMRKCLQHDFDSIYVLDLGGNVRKNPKLSGTTHNIFGIQVGVSVNLFVRKKGSRVPKRATIHYASVDGFWKKEQKYDFLRQKGQISEVDWQEIKPDPRHNWLTAGMDKSFESLLSLGTKEAKNERLDSATIFKTFSLGVGTNRDEWVYDFSKGSLERKVRQLVDNYNYEVFRFSQKTKIVNMDDFVNDDPAFVKWTDRLKTALKNHETISFDSSHVRLSLYRPFCRQYLYFDHLLNQRRYRQSIIFPTASSEGDNRVICVPSVGGRTAFWSFCANLIPNLTLTSVDANQCFPFYTYDEDGGNRQENITDWALVQFQTQYGDTGISKLDIFHYIYAILHHPQYRLKYAANLKRGLPRIPFAPDFPAFATMGGKLANLHVNYENQPEYPLKWLENKDAKVNYRVERMALSRDKTSITYNDFLTLSGVPPEVFEYRLGNRSALDWVIDQYRVSADKRSAIASDPNRADDPKYIIRLIGKVITVSLNTLKIVQSLPPID